MRLAGRVVVVTGAARGIGRALAREFAQRGAAVALVALSLEQFNTTVEEEGLKQYAVRCYACDVSVEKQVMATFDEIGRELGGLDIPIRNAGVTRDAVLIKVENGKVLRRMSMEQWRKVIDVNLSGVFLCGREAGAQMAALGKGGVIINISSVSRVAASKSMAGCGSDAQGSNAIELTSNPFVKLLQEILFGHDHAAFMSGRA